MMDSSKVKLGIAPIAWTNDDIPEIGGDNTFEQCVSEMALAGYTGSEVGNKYPKDPAVLKKYLDIRGLTICNQWFSSFLASKPFAEVEKEFRAQLDFLSKVGAKVIGPSEQTRSCQGDINTSVFSGKAEFNNDEWKTMTQGFNKLGQIAKEEGFKMALHHHMGTGIQTMEETERFLNDTDPEKVYLLYDSGHFTFSGEDAVACLAKFIGRVGHVHLKDIRKDVFEKAKAEDMSFPNAFLNGVFTIPGDGFVDFPSIFRILEESGYEGWMVVEAEQDPAKANPFEYAVMARDYIRKHTGL